MDDGAGGAFGAGFLQHLVVPGYFVIGVEEEVAMSFDETGEEGGPFEVDDDRAGWRLDRAGGAGGFDEAAVYEDLPAVMHLFTVKYLVGPQQVEAVCGGRVRVPRGRP